MPEAATTTNEGGTMSAAELKDKVLKMVEKELRKNPAAETGLLHKKAIDIDPSLNALDPRRFHAQYALSVKRRLGKPAAPAATSTPADTPVNNGGRTRPERAKPSIKRSSKTINSPAATTSTPATPDRAKVKAILLSFARKVAQADNPGALVELIGNMDPVVDQLEKTLK